MEINALNSIIVTISGMGLLLICLLWDRLRQVNRTRQLKRHRSKREGLCDLLNFAACIGPGIVIGKNGALIAGWEYLGSDNTSLSDAERDAVSVRLNQALVRLGSGWMLHLDAVRSELNPYAYQRWSNFPDRISKAIDDERREFFSQPGAAFASRFVICVSYLPPHTAVKKLSELIYEDTRRKSDPRAEAQNTLAMFERELGNLENRLSSSFQLRRLGPRKELTEDGREVVFDDLLSHLQYCVTGIRQPVRLKEKCWLDAQERHRTVSSSKIQDSQLKLPLTHTRCPSTVVSAPIEIVWSLLTDPAKWGDFFDVRITRVQPPGSAVIGQRFYGESGPRFIISG